jgi:uncharacterized coiled-coil DUF342 family protein
VGMLDQKLNEVNEEINALVEKMKEVSAKIDEFTDFRNKLRDRIVFLEGQKDTNKGESSE